jgi:hypothetical protein
LDSQSKKLLSWIRHEFLTWGMQGDGRYVRIRLERDALVQEDGKVDLGLLQRIAKATCDDLEVLHSEGWCHSHAGDPGQLEQVLALGLATPHTYALYIELCAGLVRCLMGVPFAAADLKLSDADPANQRKLAGLWTEILVNWALEQTHPVLYALRGQIKDSGQMVGSQCFDLGHGCLFIPNTESGRIKRMQQVATAPHELVEMQCGLFRASAYGIDRIVEQYGG